MAEEDDLLACLLDVAEAELISLNRTDNLISTKSAKTVAPNNGICNRTTAGRLLFDADIFGSSSDTKDLQTYKTSTVEKELELIHTGDADSSDDEANRNFESRKYSECGREIKSLLGHHHTSSSTKSEAGSSEKPFQIKPFSSNWKSKPGKNKSLTPFNEKGNGDLNKSAVNIYTDPIFGISIVNPLISSKALQEQMAGRKAVPIFKLGNCIKSLRKDDDWVVAGVVCGKGLTKTSAKGNSFVIWTLTDLLGDIKTIGVFLFGSAYKQFWKTQPGSVVGILNPGILDKKEGCRDVATLSVDNAQKILILGQSKDLGTCKSIKKNGDKCTAIVNKTKCEFCIYHVKQEYQKCSRRTELQANFSGKGLIALRNKVLGKNEVFYAGKSYTAIPAKQSRKLIKKDQNRLQSLSGACSAPSLKTKVHKIQKTAVSFDAPRSQRIKDIETLRKLGIETEDTFGTSNDAREFKASHSRQVTMDEAKSNALKVLTSLNKKTDMKKHPSDESRGGKTPPIENNTRSDSKQFDNVQLQKSLDEIVNKDFIDLDVDFESNSRLVGPENTSNQHENIQREVRIIEHRDLLNSVEQSNIGNEEIIFDTSTISNIKTRASECSLNKKHINSNSKVSNETPIVSSNGLPEKKLMFSNSLVMSTFPTLSKTNISIDLNEAVIPRNAKKAKLNALKFIQKNGPLKKVDPNNIRGTGMKRSLDSIEAPMNAENVKKLKKIQENEFLSDRFKKMMELQSKHMDLVEMRDDEEKEKYFHKLEKKEEMEEKMANTYKIECKAVRCLTCKYTSFSAADKCKAEKHRLKVFNAIKRFFKCGHCGNCTVSLDIVPIHPCKNCGSGNWERTSMIKDKKITNSVGLSIRGGEQKFVNSVVTDANINLLVPDGD